MKIASAAVALQSQHVATARQQEHETLQAWNSDGLLASAIAHISEAARAAQALPFAPAATGAGEAEALAAADASDNDPILSLIRGMVEMLTGKPIKLFSPRTLTAATDSTAVQTSSRQAASPPRTAGQGIEYNFHAVREEMEIAVISAQGHIRTSDGALIDFKLDLAMARYHREETNISVRAGDTKRKDPLVINFDGTAAQLSDRKFKFDLDADGHDENISLFANGSGYLALDLNHNGRIDNGNELFGPASNDGFANLARYDQDGNGWIDENDTVFDALRIWTPAAEDPGKLETLGTRGVGALYLGRTASPFELRGSDNKSLGGVKETGIYLTEEGQAGTLQEIDLTV